MLSAEITLQWMLLLLKHFLSDFFGMQEKLVFYFFLNGKDTILKKHHGTNGEKC